MIAADISFCLSLIGKPWISGACGPDAFDCWGLVRYIFSKQRGITLPEYPGVSESGRLAMVKNAQAEVAAHWSPVPAPSHLDVVGMSEGSKVHHCGLWLAEGSGGILHSFQGGGVVFQSMASVRQAGLQNFTFYQFRP